MVKHVLGTTTATAGILLCTLLPFLPGGHDSLAVPLSAMARAFGVVGLLLVPVGALWLASGYSRRLAPKQYPFAVTALIALSLVWALVSLVALFESGLSLAVGAFALGAYVILRLAQRIRRPRTATHSPAGALPVYLLVVPVAVALLQWVIANPATEFSRGHAIRKSAPLIADIERYRATHGRYPMSLLAVWKDYSPAVIGIEKFHYEPSDDAYNLFFEQTSFVIGTREFVVYNPLDRQVMISHAMDRLQFTGADLELRRGYYAVHDMPQPHWRYFLFD